MNNTVKSLPLGKIESVFSHPTAEELAVINTRTKREYSADELVVLTVHLCNSDKDKVDEIMSDTFLEEFAQQAMDNNLPGQLNHIEDVKDTWANIFEAHVVDEEGRKAVQGRAYVVLNDKTQEILDKLEAGTIGNISVSFNGQGEPYGDSFIWQHCLCAREFSIVVCPCQDNTGVSKELNSQESQHPTEIAIETKNNTTNGGKRRMKSIDRFKALIKKSMDEAGAITADAETASSLMNLLEEPDRELSEYEMQLAEELEQEKACHKSDVDALNAKIAELEAQLAEMGAQADEQETAAIDTLLDAEVEKLNPLTPTVKSNMLRDIDRSKLRLTAGKVEGLTEQMEIISKSYEGLFGKKEQTPEKKTAPFATVSHKKAPTKRSFDEACQTLL